jgi:hypothetical protein
MGSSQMVDTKGISLTWAAKHRCCWEACKHTTASIHNGLVCAIWGEGANEERWTHQSGLPALLQQAQREI